MKLSISTNGTLTKIYNDEDAALLARGKASIARASHVEPTADGTGWTADMSPTTLGVILGPFPLRQTALEAEVQFLDSLLFRSSAPTVLIRVSSVG